MDNKQLNINQEEDEIDLIEMSLELLNHWLFISLITILVAGIVLTYNIFFITPLYESTAELYMLDSSSSISSLADIQIGNNLSSDYIAVSTSRPVLDTVISNLSLEEEYKQLSKKVTVVNDKDTHILKITVKDPNPTRAKLITDEIAKVAKSFIADKMGQKEPSVLHYGYADGQKVSPSKAKNTIIGAAVGFVLSAGLVILSWLIHDVIKTEEDVEKKIGLPVLGTIPYEKELQLNDKGGKIKWNN